MSSSDAVERHLAYLLDEEKEERNERRGLEQRAGGLIAALLIGFPVAGTVAKNADFSNGAQAVGLCVLALALVAALIQAWRVTAALGAPRRERNKIKSAREAVQAALAEDRLADAVVAQQTIVATMRTDNGETVRRVRNVTATLPLTLLGVLIALSLIVAGGSASTTGPVGPRGARGPAGQRGPAGPRGPRGRPATSTGTQP